MNPPSPRLLLAGCLLLAGSAPAFAADPEPHSASHWPQWRGPANNGLSHAKGLPTSWSATQNVAWKFEMPGTGSSTPAVWGERLFLTCQDDKTVLLLCVGTDGKQKWKRDLGAATRKTGRGDEGNEASPSPATDGKRVYAMAGNGEFAAFDLDGKEEWRFNAQTRYGKFRIAFGMHSTPVLHEGKLYFQLIHDGGGTVACVDAADGKEVWKINRASDGTQENKHSYASPFMWSDGKSSYLVCHGNDYATAHDLKDGAEIWRVGDLNPRDNRYNQTLRFVASPVCTPDLIVIPSAKNGCLVAIRPDLKGKALEADNKFVWRNPRGTPDVPSPAVQGGLVYVCGEGGGLTVLDAKTGEQVTKVKTHGHRHRASPVLADGKVYMLARDGTASVTTTGRDAKLLATNKLPDDTAASIAVAGKRVYVRGYKYLWAIEAK